MTLHEKIEAAKPRRVTLDDRHKKNGNRWDKSNGPGKSKYAYVAVHGAGRNDRRHTLSCSRGLEQTDSGVTAHIHYKEKAYGTLICRLESCEGSDVTGASSQGVEANRCVAFSHSRGAVGWCQWPTGSPSPSDGTTDADTVSRHASIRFRSAILKISCQTT